MKDKVRPWTELMIIITIQSVSDSCFALDYRDKVRKLSPDTFVKRNFRIYLGTPYTTMSHV